MIQKYNKIIKNYIFHSNINYFNVQILSLNLKIKNKIVPVYNDMIIKKI